MILTGPLRRTEVPVKRISGTNMGGVLDMSMRGVHTFLHPPPPQSIEWLSYLPHEQSLASKRNKSFNIRFLQFAEKYIIDTELEIKLCMLWYECTVVPFSEWKIIIDNIQTFCCRKIN